VTNVPGPNAPFYLAGSRMLAAYPHLPLFEQQGVGIALLSYLGRVHVGVAVDWNLGDLLAELMGDLEAAFEELAGLAGVGRRRPRRSTSRAVRGEPAAWVEEPAPR
jgi:hypothetical protein